jgi:hypothetical protein
MNFPASAVAAVPRGAMDKMKWFRHFKESKIRLAVLDLRFLKMCGAKASACKESR